MSQPTNITLAFYINFVLLVSQVMFFNGSKIIFLIRLGPLLFLVYINDIVNDIGSNIRLFADDTSLYIVVDNPLVAAETLNADLEKISCWAATWLVTFNPDKCVALLFSRKVSTTFYGKHTH